MEGLAQEAYGKLIISIFSFVMFGLSIVAFKRYRKRDYHYYNVIAYICLLIFSGFFSIALGLPATKQIYDIKTNNFIVKEGYVESINDAFSEKGGVLLTINNDEYVLVRENNYGVHTGDYVNITYGKTSKAIINIEEKEPI